MSSISMAEFRRNAEGVLRRVEQGQRLILTYRSRPVARLEPYAPPTVPVDDPIYRLSELAVAEGESLSNDEMDAIVYG